MKNKTNYEKLIKAHDGALIQSDWVQEAKKEVEHDWRKNSQKIALRILREIRLKEISQTVLAEKMEVSPQLISKWVKGNENFTLETIGKIERALGINLLNIELKSEKKNSSLPTIKFNKVLHNEFEMTEHSLLSINLIEIHKMRDMMSNEIKYKNSWTKRTRVK
ncbi:helix-turn-helix transcriptional regulator [Elizabethkingia miricola]|uniref:helix-turn-helix transcriptional regulator n=1 Tax=Elizabethkingia miricola TaxID=172045 RepID=UPI0038912674